MLGVLRTFRFSGRWKLSLYWTGERFDHRGVAQIVKKVTGFKGDIVYNPEMPDGTPQKLLYISRMKELGWEARTSLEQGIRKTYQWYVENLGTKSLE